MSLSFGQATGSAVIHQFTTSSNAVKRGEPFTLSWNVDAADKIELYRNGGLFQTLSNAESSIQRTEFYDSQKEVTYELIAYQKGIPVRSKPIIIRFHTQSSPVSNTDTVKLLAGSSMWAKFISICGIVLLSLFVLVSIIMMVTDDQDAEETMMGTMILLAVYLAPAIILLSFSNKTSRAIEKSNGTDLAAPLRSLKQFFQVVGITIIVLMVTLIILFLVNANQ